MQPVRIACLLAIAVPVSGAITVVSHTSANGTQLSVTSPAIDTTGANLLVTCIAGFMLENTPVMTDSKSNAWTALTIRGSGNSAEARIYYTVPTSVGTGHTFTFTNALNGFVSIGVLALAGASATPYDTDVGTAASSSGTSVQPGSITPAQANEILVACGDLEADYLTPSVNLGFTLVEQVAFSSGNGAGLLLAYLIQTTATAENPTFSWTNTVTASAAMAAFEAAATTTVNHGSPPSIF